MNATDVINTSNIAKLYRTTTGDIEKKLRAMGHKPIRTVTMQSGRRFMVWDRKAVIKSLDDYKATRLQMLQDREALRKELEEKQRTVPRTGYGATELPDVPTDFAGLDDKEHSPTPSNETKQLLEQMRLLQEEFRKLQLQLAEKDSKDSAP